MIKVAQTKQTFPFLAPEKVLCKNPFLAREYVVDITYKCLPMHESKKNVGASNKQKSINEGGFASIRTKNLGNQWPPLAPSVPPALLCMH